MKSFRDYLGLSNSCSYDVIGRADRFGFQNFCSPDKYGTVYSESHTLFVNHFIFACSLFWFWLSAYLQKLNEPQHDKTNKMISAPSEDSDQPGHPLSLIKVLAVCMKKPWVLNYLLTASERLWSVWVDVPRLICVLAGRLGHLVCFVMLHLKFAVQYVFLCVLKDWYSQINEFTNINENNVLTS